MRVLRAGRLTLLLCVPACLLAVLLVLAATGSPAAASPAPDPPAAVGAAASGLRFTREERAADAILAAQRRDFLERHAASLDRLFTGPIAALRRELAHEKLYQTLQDMPKGGMLHIHATATGRASWIVDRALSEPRCFIYWGPPSDRYARGQLAFFPGQTVPAGWLRVATVARFVPHLRARLLALYTLGPEDAASTDIWKEFEAAFQRVDAFVSYRPVFVDYYAHAFRVLARDGVQFVELRTSVDPLLDEHGRSITDEAVLDLYRSVLARVRATYPSFDLRLIVCTWRGASLQDAAAQMERTRRLMRSAPDLIAGFDVVGEEDGGNSNAFYAPVLSSLPQVSLFLHGGESLSPADTNVRDAWLLGSTRISHGLNIGLFPGLEAELRQSGVMLEVCPLSNKALRYVPDPRLHPAKGLLRRGLRIVLGSDDPAIFGTVGLTDDFWTVYVAWRLDLHTLKLLALDSILRSSLPADRRERQRDLFERGWQRFIRGVIEEDREAAAGSALPQALPDAA